MSVVDLPPGLLAVSPKRLPTPSIAENSDLEMPPGALQYNASEYASHSAAQTPQRDNYGSISPPPGALGDGTEGEVPVSAEADTKSQATAQDSSSSLPMYPALKLQVHIKQPYHVGLKSLAHAERDAMEHGLVNEMCKALEIDPSLLELLDVDYPTGRPMQASGTGTNKSAPSPLTIRDSEQPLSHFDLSTLKSFACMFNCDDVGHLNVREIVARLRANVSLAPLLRRPLQLHGTNVPARMDSLNDRFSAMHVAPGTVATFEDMIKFFGADDAQFSQYTADHPVHHTPQFLKDFEVAYARKAFRGMDVAGSTFLRRQLLAKAGGRLSSDLQSRFEAFGDEFINETEVTAILDDHHGEGMSAWRFKELVEKLEAAYVQLLATEERETGGV